MLLFYQNFQSSFAYIPSSFVLKWLNSALSHKLILFDVTFIQVFMSIKLHFSVGPLWMGSQIFVFIAMFMQKCSIMKAVVCQNRHIFGGVEWAASRLSALCTRDVGQHTPEILLLLYVALTMTSQRQTRVGVNGRHFSVACLSGDGGIFFT